MPALTPRGLNRPLTEAERLLLHDIFGNALDTDAIRICAARFMPFQAASVAMSPNGYMYFPPQRLYCHDFACQAAPRRALFVHEAVHVWQRQLGYPVLLCGLCLALQGGYWRNRAYRYRHLLDRRPHFSRFNMEQQAQMVADYHQHLWQHGQTDAALHAVLQPFFDRPHDPALLPRRIWV